MKESIEVVLLLALTFSIGFTVGTLAVSFGAPVWTAFLVAVPVAFAYGRWWAKNILFT